MTFRGIAPTGRPLIIPVFITHRGCTHRCSFCDQEAIAGAGSLPDAVPGIVEKYLGWSSGDRPVELSFYGGSFTALPVRELGEYLQVGKDLIARKLVGSLRCSTRPDTINPGMATLLKGSGFTTVELGAQTMSDRLLTEMERGHTADDTRQAVKDLKEAGLTVVLQFMSGYPDETATDVATTCRALIAARPDAIRIYPFMPLAGTKISQRLQCNEARFDPVAAIDRAADIFLAAQEAGIPTIRIGLPKEGIVVSPYPDNLAQVVVAEALAKLAKTGEREFELPAAWETSVSIARKSGRWPEEAKVVFL